MVLINLRPWREERNAARQKQFVSNLAASAVAAVIVVFLIGAFVDAQIDRQKARNTYMKAEIAKLDQLRQEIIELEDKKTRLLERLQAVHELQGNRPLIVRNFDELVRVLPDGMHYTLLTRKSEDVNVTGQAKDNTEVSTLLRNLNQSPWFGEPNLSEVDSKNGNKVFKLKVKLKRPNAEEGVEDEL
ncbi:MAG: PilN domain-containing protein [Pontibacterium sp.]